MNDIKKVVSVFIYHFIQTTKLILKQFCVFESRFHSSLKFISTLPTWPEVLMNFKEGLGDGA